MPWLYKGHRVKRDVSEARKYGKSECEAQRFCSQESGGPLPRLQESRPQVRQTRPQPQTALTYFSSTSSSSVPTDSGDPRKSST